MKERKVVPAIAGLASLLVLISQLGEAMKGEALPVLVTVVAALLLGICIWRLIK